MFAFPYSRLGCVMSGGAGWCKLQLTRHKSPPADQRVVQLWWSSSCKAVAAPSWDRATSRGRHFLRRNSRPPPLVASSFSPHALLFYSFLARKQSWGSELVVAWENGWWQNWFENRILHLCIAWFSLLRSTLGLPADHPSADIMASAKQILSEN